MDLTGVGRHSPSRLADADREAGVLAPVIEREDGVWILFTKRAEHLGEHPGQMSFPGGGREPVDADLEATALRESHEEIGLRPEEATVVGSLDDIETVTRYIVRPFVARVPDRAYTPDEREVAEIARLPVDGLADRANYESERRDHPEYGPIRIHFFHVDGYTVWGATAEMLVQLLELTTDWRMPRAVDRVVDPDAELPI
jgi:8-oxo-dGTP pyrophosphatase MutT (NUDIX family)